MSKGFLVSLAIIFLIVTGYMIPSVLISDNPWWQQSIFDAEIKSMLSPVEKLLVIKTVDDGYKPPVTVAVYTLFGVKYATVSNEACKDPALQCKPKLVFRRLWIKTDKSVNFSY